MTRRLLNHRALQIFLALWLLAGSAWAAFPPTIDSDVQVRAGGPATVGAFGFWSNFVVEGWLHLALAKGSTTKYVGTLTDNLSGGKAYEAKADVSDPAAPVLQIMSRYGKIVFTMNSSFGGSGTYSSSAAKTKPALFATATSFNFFGNTHAYSTVTYTLGIDMVVGVPNSKALINGMTLTLIRDSLAFIVPRDPITRAVSSLVVPTSPKPIFTRITAPGYFGTFNSNGSSTNGLNLTINCLGRNFSLNGLTNGGSVYSGTAVTSGMGSAAAIGTFYAAPPNSN